MSEEIKVSEMQEAEEVNDEDIVMVIQKKVNKKAKIKQIKNELAVSPTQPTTREKVWFKIGKNKFDKLGYIENIETGKSRTINLKLEPNTTYTMSSNISKTSNNTADLFFASGYNASVSTDANGVWNGQSRTVTSDENGYVTVAYRKQLTSQAPSLIDAWYQIEQGSTATTYEEYVEPGIYVKNNNNVYEEFISKESLDNYSTGEKRIGTWTDGKPLYRKVISGYWSFETGDTNIAHNISNLDLCIRADLFRIDIGHISWEFPYVSESGGFTGITKVTPENVIVKAYNDTWSNNNNGYIILEYTKTTD